MLAMHSQAGQAMAAALATAVEQEGPVGGDLLVANHAGYLSFLALEVVAALSPEAPSQMRARADSSTPQDGALA